MNYQIEKYIRNLFYQAQQGQCPICLKPLEGKLALDHVHDNTGEPRGLLHQRCNMMVAQKETRTKKLNYIISRQTEERIWNYINNHIKLEVVE
jgi:DNA-binding sugar fermentation-stimulating protein